jgi:hypothetical protein
MYKGLIKERIIEVPWIPRCGDIVPEFKYEEGVVFPVQVMSTIIPIYKEGSREVTYSKYPVCYVAKTTYKNIR